MVGVVSRRVDQSLDTSCRSACRLRRPRLYGIVARGLATSDASNHAQAALFDTSSIVVTACVVLAACAGAEAGLPPRAPQAEPAATAAAAPGDLGFHPGEAMTFEVQLAGVLVGEALLAVGERGDLGGRDAIVVRSRAATAGAAALVRKIVDEATTTIDASTGAPIAVDSTFAMGEKQTIASAKFLQAYADVKFQRDREPAQRYRVDYRGHQLHDAHSAMAQLRGWRATPGAERTVFVIGGRRLWRVDVRYQGETQIGSAVGNRRAVIYEGVSYRTTRDLKPEANKPARTFRVWLSDDADRVPLQVTATTELGDIVMSLTEYARP
jgi:hypothetical protein